MFTNSGMVQFKNLFTELKPEIIRGQLLVRSVFAQEENIMTWAMLATLHDITHSLKC